MIKKKSRLYLAHSCELIDSVRKWELKIQGRYNLFLINPFQSNKFENVEKLRNLKTRKKLLAYMKELDLNLCQKIVEHDLHLLRKCDGLVGVFNSPSIGTAQEIFACVYLYNIPCYIICKEYMHHPWIVWLSHISGGKVFASRAEFERYLDKIGLRKR